MDQIIKWFNRILLFGYLVVSVLGLSLLVEWIFDDAPVIEFGQGHLLSSPVKLGESFVAIQPIHKLRDCPGRIVRALEGECGSFELSDTEAILPSDYTGNLRLIFWTPRELQAGQCRLVSRHRYWRDPLDWFLDRRRYTAPFIDFSVVR